MYDGTVWMFPPEGEAASLESDDNRLRQRSVNSVQYSQMGRTRWQGPPLVIKHIL